MTERRNDELTANVPSYSSACVRCRYTRPGADTTHVDHVRDELTAGIDRTWSTWDARAEVLRRVQETRTDLDYELQQSFTDQLLEEVGIR